MGGVLPCIVIIFAGLTSIQRGIDLQNNEHAIYITKNSLRNIQKISKAKQFDLVYSNS